MEKIRLGRTGLMVTKCGFGALPIQRVNMDEAVKIIRRAYEQGINFFDTARVYTDSEEKIGNALADVRKDIIIATKTQATDKKTLLQNLYTSLEKLKTDYIDIYQLHNPKGLSDPQDPEGPYAGLKEAKEKGLIRFVGLTNHKLDTAVEAAKSGLYDTIQFPLNYLSSKNDLELIEVCKKNDVGVIAMKALSGGLITNVVPTFVFLRQFDNLVPIWGIQRESELDEFISLENNPPVMDEEMLKMMEKDRAELGGEFCRGCGYCLPCPVEIPIPFASRMAYLLRRSPYRPFLEEDWRIKMERITQCKECGQCRKRCPYELNPPEMLKKMLADYRQFYSEHINECK